MTRINFIVNAVNNASKVFDEVKRSAQQCGLAVGKVNDKIDKLNVALETLKKSDAADTLDEIAGAASAASMGFAAANDEAGKLNTRLTRMTTRAGTLTGALKILDDELDKKVKAFGGTAGAATALSAAMAVSNVRTAAAVNLGRGWWGLLGLLNTRVALFGGIVGDSAGATGLLYNAMLRFGVRLPGWIVGIGGWHLALDAVFEILAVLIPALVAVTAFGVPAAGVVHDMVEELTNMATVVTATNGKLGPFTGGLAKMSNAVRPQVFQIFGDALSVVNDRAGFFNKLATETGQVLENLAARFAVADRAASKTLGGILGQGPADVRQLGDLFANLGSIIGGFIKAVPGYANYLLGFFDVFTKGIAEVVNSPFINWLLKAGLYFHGFIIWVGLAVTAVLLLARPLTFLATALFTFGVRLSLLGPIFAAAAAQGTILDGVLASMGAIIDATGGPLVWITALVAAVGFLIYHFASAKDSAASFLQGLQNGITSAQTLAGGIRAIGYAQIEVAQQLAQARQQLANTPLPRIVGVGRFSTVVDAAPFNAAKASVDQLLSGQRQLADETKLYNYRINGLAGSFGGLKNATNLANLAGISMKQMLDGSHSTWMTIQQQVLGTQLAYKDLGYQSGILGEDFLSLNKQFGAVATFSTNLVQQAPDMAQAIQNVNTAFADQASAVTDAQNSFDNYSQGLATLSSNFDRANPATTGFTLRLGKLHDAIKYVKSPIDGLSQSSIALNQAFTTQIGNANTLIATWRSAGVANNLFRQGVKDTIAPLVKYAAGSQEATAQLVFLAQQADYTGPVSLKRLVAWLGNTHDATANLKAIANQATIQEALLTTSMQNQGAFIADKLIGDINSSILAYNGVAQAAKNYGTAVAQFGTQSDQAHTARMILINDLIASGKAAGDSTTQIAAMITKVLQIPAKAALEIVMTGQATFSLGQGPNNAISGTTLHIFGVHSATGGLIRGGGGPTADDVPAWLSSGEYVIQASSVARYGSGMMDMINAGSFAGGGLIKAGNQDVLSGQYAVTQYANFASIMANDLVQTMASSLSSAMTSAVRQASIQSVASQFSGGGGGNSSNAALARQMMPSWAGGPEWAAWNYVAMRESGWSQYARNPSSGAYGIAQALPPTKYPFAGQAAGGSSAAAQIAWMISYIQSVYGDPIAAASHERAYNWYHRGGPVMRRFQGGGPALTPAARKPRSLTPEQNEGLTLALVFAGNNIARMIGEQGQFLRDIARYYHGSSAAWRDRKVIDQIGQLKAVSVKLDKVNATIQNARQLSGSIYSGLAQTTSLSNYSIGGGFSGTKFVSGGQMLKGQMAQSLQTLRKFLAALRKLASLHLWPGLMQQIVALGPVNGLAMAQEILAGGSSLVRQLNAEEGAIQGTERAIGRGVASYQTTGRFVSGRNFVGQLVKERDKLEKLFRDLGMELGREAARWFHVPEAELPVDLRRHRRHHGSGGGQHGGQAAVSAPLVQIDNLTVNEPADMNVLNHKINFAIISAGLGG